MSAKKPKGTWKEKEKPNENCPTAYEIMQIVSEKYASKTLRKITVSLLQI